MSKSMKILPKMQINHLTQKDSIENKENNKNKENTKTKIENTIKVSTKNEINYITVGNTESDLNSSKRASDISNMLTFNNLGITKDYDTEDEDKNTDNASNYNEQDPGDSLLVSNLTFSGETVKMNKLSFYLTCFIIAIVNIVCFIIQYHYVHIYVFSKDFSQLKFFCFGQVAGEKDLCFLSIGQFAYGIITIGQFSVGVSSISQVGIGLILGIGQVSLGYIFNIGQIAESCYVYQAQVGLALWKVRKAHIGANSIDAAVNNKSFIILGCREAISNN